MSSRAARPRTTEAPKLQVMTDERHVSDSAGVFFLEPKPYTYIETVVDHSEAERVEASAYTNN